MTKRVLRVAFWIYLLVLLRITVFRSGWYQNDFFQGTILWVPFRKLLQYLMEGQVIRFIYLFFGNVIWFVPFGLYFSAKELSLWQCTLAAACLSLLIEVLQFVFSSGYCETEDVILNTLGGFFGWLLWKSICKWKKRSEV